MGYPASDPAGGLGEHSLGERVLQARFLRPSPDQTGAPAPGADAGRAREPPSRGQTMSLLGGPASPPRTPPQAGKARMKKLPKKSQNEKYRLKYLRLRKAAKATVFVSLSARLPVCPPAASPGTAPLPRVTAECGRGWVRGGGLAWPWPLPAVAPICPLVCRGDLLPCRTAKMS